MTPKLSPEQIHAVKVWGNLGTLELIQDQGRHFPEAPSGYAATQLSAEVVKLSGLCAGLAEDLTKARNGRRDAAVAIEALVNNHATYLGLTEKANAALLEIAQSLRRTA